MGDRQEYGKELDGDIAEGKRTLMLIHLLRTVPTRERAALLKWLHRSRDARTLPESRDILERMKRSGSIDYARRVAAQHAARAAVLFEETLAFIPDSEDKAVLRQVIHYVNTRLL